METHPQHDHQARVDHRHFQSYYVRIDFDDEKGFLFDPHCLDIPLDIVATITWFTDNPNIKFKALNWCNESEHLFHHPVTRDNCMVGAVQTVLAIDDVFWKYQVEADVIVDGVLTHQASTPCSATSNGLPKIHPR